MQSHNLARFIAVAILSTGVAACITTRGEESKNAATGIAASESVVVLAASYHKGNKTEDDFLECVNDKLDDGGHSVKVYPSARFLDTLFPWFEPRTMPQGVEGLPELLARPGVAARVAETGVRYLVWVNGSTEETSGGGGMSCAASTVGGGCFGLVWWEDDGSYKASIWDLSTSTAAGQVSTDAHGTSMVPALIIPIPLIARTQTAACKNLAQELQKFLVDAGPT